jgi:tetratricopeptide (TPR) repeat protein
MITNEAPIALSYIQALAGLAWPITALIIVIGTFFVGIGIAARWFRIEISWGEFRFNVGRPENRLSDEAALITAPPENDVELPEPVQSIEDEIEGASNPARDNLLAYLRAKNLDQLDQHYLEFISEIKPDGLEFWETEHLRRRADLGVDHGREAVNKLVEEHPDWVFPYKVMLDWSIEENNEDLSRSFISNGLKRSSSDFFSAFLRSCTKFYAKFEGLSEAVAFCMRWSRAHIPERAKAALFLELGKILEDRGFSEGTRLAHEWALSLISDPDQEFNLAYSYSTSTGHWPMAMWHYDRVTKKSENPEIARNNIAIVLGNFDQSLQISFYEKAVSEGEKYATANLASCMIDDGYLDAAEVLLSKFDDFEDASETHANAKAKLLAARRALAQTHEDTFKAIKDSSQGYRVAVQKSFRFKQMEKATPTGWYISDDCLCRLEFSSSGAECSLRIGSATFIGSLEDNGVCYAGTISQQGGGILSTTHDITVLHVEEDAVELFRWPSSIGAQSRPVSYMLRVSDQEPPPLPVLTAPASNTLSGLLGIGASALT